MADDPNIRDDDRSYEPSTPQANRSIEQGNGVGAREIAAQREPTERAEHDPFREQHGEKTSEDKRVKNGPGFF